MRIPSMNIMQTLLVANHFRLRVANRLRAKTHFFFGYWSSSFLLNSIGHFRLYSKTEQLEQLMGEEVTDINEILAVINNIQVPAQSCRLYNIRHSKHLTYNV